MKNKLLLLVMATVITNLAIIPVEACAQEPVFVVNIEDY